MKNKQLSAPFAPIKLRWPTNSEDAQYMKMRKKQNRIASKNNPNELWMKAKLAQTKYQWSWQSRWGYRIFDFWCHYLGIAIEVDGKSHNKWFDMVRDEYNLRKSGILVIRVRNKDEDDAQRALEYINTTTENWNDRRILLGLKPLTNIPLSSNGSEISQLGG